MADFSHPRPHDEPWQLLTPDLTPCNTFHGASQHDYTASAYSNGMEDQDLAAALKNFQECNDCTPATKTNIPHHHHPPGRLAGASAQLDGHFCCCWLVHGQPCFLCFQSAEALDNHIKNDHAGKDGSYRCLWQDCAKHNNSTKATGTVNFGNKPKLMRHVHSHTGYKPFPCSYPGCDKGFVTKEQLKNHETTHTKARKYQCDQCGKAFAVKSALTTHIAAVHEDKKAYKCDVCGKAFADSSNLSKHKQTHVRDGRVKKQRSRRGTANATSTRSTPSISTPVGDFGLPPAMQSHHMHSFSGASIQPAVMAPPSLPKDTAGLSFTKTAAAYNGIYESLAASSPPPEDFDPDCYCCDQLCPAPDGPATPCDEADDCHREGFCDLPECVPTPCNSAGDCDEEGFCDLPDCFGQQDHLSELSSPNEALTTNNCTTTQSHYENEHFRIPQPWYDFSGGQYDEAQQPYLQHDFENQFVNMHRR